MLIRTPTFSFSKCFPFIRKRKAEFSSPCGVKSVPEKLHLIFVADYSVHGRPNRKNKAPFSSFSVDELVYLETVTNLRASRY